MDFVKDIELIARSELDHHGMKHSGASGWELVLLFLNFRSKLIAQVSRKVVTSRKIQTSTYDETTTTALTAIRRKFDKGEDVNPHLSQRILKPAYGDWLLADWGIYHLHLNTEPDEKDNRFVKGVRNVLFLTLFGDSVYFIDIRPHGRTGDKDVFEQKSLLKTIADEWPWILEPHKVPWAIGLENEVKDAKDIKALRKAGVSVFHKINDAVYLPCGGGLTGRGTSAMVTRRANQLYYGAKNAHQYIEENRSQINKLLAVSDKYNPNDSRFRVCLLNDEFLVYEERTRMGIVYLES
jgi:hypothetical protein